MYRYRCGVCRTISDHLYAYEAEDEQRRHIVAVHDGREPERQSITPFGPPASPAPEMPTSTRGESPNRALARGVIALVTKTKLMLATTVLLVGVTCWYAYGLIGILFPALPQTHPVPPPASHPTP